MLRKSKMDLLFIPFNHNVNWLGHPAKYHPSLSVRATIQRNVMEEYSDEAFEAIQNQTQEWGESFSTSHYFTDLTKKQQNWAEPVITAFTEMMYAYHGRRPEKWTVKIVEECCTQTIPRKVAVDNDFFQAIAPVLTAFFGFLQSAGHIRNGAALIKTIRRIEKKIVNNASEPENWGMAKSILSGAHNAGVDFTDEDELQEFIMQLNDGMTGDGALPNFPIPGIQGQGRKGRSQVEEESPQEIILQFAQRIAKQLSQEKTPSISSDMKVFFKDNPGSLFDLLFLLDDSCEDQEETDEWLITALLGMVEMQLEEIRYGVDRGYDWAIDIIKEFQTAVVELAESDQLPPMVVKEIMTAIHNAKLEHSPELLQAFDEMFERIAPEEKIPTREEFIQVLHHFVEEKGDDPFGISEGISDMIRYMPEDAQSFLIGEFCNADLPGVKDAIALLTLSQVQWIRQEALQWLLGNPKTITPTALRRLIVIRNWIPEAEKKILDKVTKAARKQGVECAQWTPGERLEKIQVSQIDGAGAQSLMLSTKAKSGFRFATVLMKQGVGIADVWETPTTTKRKVNSIFEEFGETSVHATISEHYMDSTISHNIQIGLDSGKPPQTGLLRVAEIIGATNWQAQSINFQKLLEEIIDEATQNTLQFDLVEDILHSSAIWGELPGISDSWFEDSHDVVEFLKKTRIKKRERLIQKILKDFIEPNRQIWAEKFSLTAFWFNEQPAKHKKKNSMGHNFAIIARELFAGRPMVEIPLMEAIAQRTVAAIRGG
jgi:hypothetical protein